MNQEEYEEEKMTIISLIRIVRDTLLSHREYATIYDVAGILRTAENNGEVLSDEQLWKIYVMECDINEII